MTRPGEISEGLVPSFHLAEQGREDFHHESTFMRFRPLSEHGTWRGGTLLPP
ncbi:hypothetical protein [Prauserella alba]|uniref:hypothetical protein n=1 Tax=Prauserella alba TaxID=176898 RepID=UPI0020A2A821|nr:hypothetical protein [Prauserella alba]